MGALFGQDQADAECRDLYRGSRLQEGPQSLQSGTSIGALIIESGLQRSQFTARRLPFWFGVWSSEFGVRRQQALPERNLHETGDTFSRCGPSMNLTR